MGRPLSEYRSRIRTALRVYETESHDALSGEELATRARVPMGVIAHYVRLDLNAGLKKMPDILSTLDPNGYDAKQLWEMAIRQNPYPMYWNRSNDFQDPIFVHLTEHRFEKLLGKFGLKQKAARTNKFHLVQRISESCSALAEALKGPRIALRIVPALPPQAEVKL